MNNLPTVDELVEERDYWKHLAQREQLYYHERLREMHEQFQARTEHIVRMNEYLTGLIAGQRAPEVTVINIIKKVT